LWCVTGCWQCLGGRVGCALVGEGGLHGFGFLSVLGGCAGSLDLCACRVV
jgi:hypothetical protein